MSTSTVRNTMPVKPRILICDDDIAFSTELIEALRMRKFPATALLTISEMRAAILGPSVLLLDLCMPDRDGIEILNLLANHERRDHFKIVMISGSDDGMLEIAAELCRARGLHLLGVFRKPLNVQELCNLLESAGVSRPD